MQPPFTKEELLEIINGLWFNYSAVTKNRRYFEKNRPEQTDLIEDLTTRKIKINQLLNKVQNELEKLK